MDSGTCATAAVIPSCGRSCWPAGGSCAGTPPTCRPGTRTGWRAGRRLAGQPAAVLWRADPGLVRDLGDDGEVEFDRVAAAGPRCRSTRRSTCHQGSPLDQRDRPGGFTADRDVLDTWATSSLTPGSPATAGCRPRLFDRVFPYDLHPQAHEIIRTWLFTEVLRSHQALAGCPGRDTAISGWVLDPDRKKMSKSRGNVTTPAEPLDQFGPDAVRYWAASARLGVDTAYDQGKLRVGRRLAVKLLNVARFVLGLPEPSSRPPTAAVDRAALARLADTVADRHRGLRPVRPRGGAGRGRVVRVVVLRRPRGAGQVTGVRGDRPGRRGVRGRRRCGPRSRCCCGCSRRCCRS